MGYIESFKYDIFISYSHIDNEKTPGTTYSWIEMFYEELTLSLWQSIGTKKLIFGGITKGWMEDRKSVV